MRLKATNARSALSLCHKNFYFCSFVVLPLAKINGLPTESRRQTNGKLNVNQAEFACRYD